MFMENIRAEKQVFLSCLSYASEKAQVDITATG